MKRLALIAGLLPLVGVLGFCMDVAAGVRGSFGYGGFLGKDYPPYVWSYHYLDRVCFPDWEAAAFLTMGGPLAIQLEAMYLRLGAALREEVIAPHYTEYIRADYLAYAALLKLRYQKQSLFAGPVLMHRIGLGSHKYKYEAGSTVEAGFADGKPSPIQLAGACGLDRRLGAGRGNLLLGLRWIYSFTSFGTLDYDDWNPYAYLVSVGYAFAQRR